jgi:hypothetical protein
MDDKYFNKKLTEKNTRTIINSKILTISFLVFILIFFPTQIYSSNVTSTSPTDGSTTQTIEQIANQITIQIQAQIKQNISNY